MAIGGDHGMKKLPWVVLAALLIAAPVLGGNSGNSPPRAAGGVTSVNGQTGAVTVGSGALYEANASALAAVASSALPEGQAAYVGTLKSTFVLTLSSQTTVPLVIVTANGKSGYQWIRNDGSEQGWWQQVAWSEDPANSTGLASDENTGLDDTHPLLTWSELNRRMKGATYYGTNPTIRLLSDTPITDYFQPDITVRASDSGGGTVAALWIMGVPIVQVSGGTGALTAVQNTTANPTMADTEITDSGVAWSSWVGFLVYRATTRAYAWVAKDLGSSKARISQPLNTRDTVGFFGGTTAQALAIGNAYQVLKVPKMPLMQAINGYQNSTIVIQQVEIIGNVIGLDFGARFGVQYRCCKVSGTGVFAEAEILSNCCFTGGGVSIGGAGPAVSLTGGLFIGAGATTYFITNGGQVIFNGISTFQGCGLTVTHYAFADAIAMQYFDSSADAIDISHKSRAYIASIGGSGNSGKLINVADAGCMASVTVAGLTGGATSDGSPYLVRGTSSADTSTTATQVATNLCGIVPQ